MKAWYLSYARFEKRIIRKWGRSGFDYNAGNVHLLRYSYQTTMFWGIVNQKKLSAKNKGLGYPTLF